MKHLRFFLLLLQRIRGAFINSAQLLAPHSECCLICSKPSSLANGTGSLHASKLSSQLRQMVCGACLSTVPWLTRIVCKQCGRGIACEDCSRGVQHSFIYNRSAVYYNQAMKGLLAQYKYRGNEQLAPLLGDMLLPAFKRMTAQILDGLANGSAGTRTKLRCWDAVTYVPISAERAADRGFNQAEQLAMHIAQNCGVPLRHLLERARHTEKQSFKTRSERMRDTKRLFIVKETELRRLQADSIKNPRKLRVLLVDDIYTTGSTAEACSQVLLQHAKNELEVYVLTWARS